MRKARLNVAVFVVAAALTCLCTVAVAAEAPDVLQRAHAWARFGKGAWRRVRIVTENFDVAGRVVNSSVADNLTTLEEITPEGVTLKVATTVEVAGQSFPSPPQTVHQGYAGESIGQTVSRKSLSDETLTVDGRDIPCQAQQIEILGGGNREVIEISYSPAITPTILRFKSTTSDPASGRTVAEALSEVFALDKRVRVLDEPDERRGYRMRQILKSDRGRTTTWSDHVADVPGEVVSHTAQKFDEQGRLIRRTTLELVDYGLDDERGGRDMTRRQRRQQRRAR
ncbi:MAG: hypothetical protein AB7O59_05890 [Pirellulales bacterium]